MARQDYMTIAVNRSTQEIFRKFIEKKELTVKEALSDMMELYMMATDEVLYRELKNDCLNVEGVREMILDRNNIVNKNDSLFMKLGYVINNQERKMNAHETMETYIRNCNENGYTWYSTNSLTNGMNAQKVKRFNELAKNSMLTIYFAMNQGGIDNDIAYSAQVDEIVSHSQPASAPCKDSEYPEEWTGEKRNLWIRVHDIKEEREVSADDFIVISTGNNLKDVIKKGQYIFGYIRRK